MPKPSSKEALVVPHSWFAVSVYFSGYVVLEAFWKYSLLLYNGKAVLFGVSICTVYFLGGLFTVVVLCVLEFVAAPSHAP